MSVIEVVATCAIAVLAFVVLNRKFDELFAHRAVNDAYWKDVAEIFADHEAGKLTPRQRKEAVVAAYERRAQLAKRKAGDL